MRRLGNTLYITTQGSYLSKDGDCVAVSREGAGKTRVPLTAVDGLVCFGQVSLSPFLMGHCADSGVCVSFLTETGRFLARVEGAVSGNVLLRRAQYRAADDAGRRSALVHSLVAGKVANQRHVLRRARRDHGEDAEGRLADALRVLNGVLRRASPEGEVDVLRGQEGEAARAYFSAFPTLLRSEGPAFRFAGRVRRPPTDPVNALLSFVYVLLTHDVRGSLETVGLDPAVGFLHAERPGRPSLALDVVEEFRAWFADRLVLSLINRGQVKADDFETGPSGAVTLTEEGRRTVLVAYQERKREEVVHPFTKEKAAIGLLWFVQARLLAMHLRGDLDAYPPFLAK